MAIALQAVSNNLTGSPAETTTYTSVSSQTSGSYETYQINCSGDHRMGVVICSGYRSTNVDISLAVTWGGVSMSSFPICYGNAGPGTLVGTTSSFAQFFYLADPATGSQDVVTTWSSASSSGSFVLTSMATSWTGVGGVGSHSYEFGTETGTSLSMTVSSATGRVIVQHFEHEPTSGGTRIADYNQTHIAHTRTGAISQGLLGYAVGDSSVTFTATRASGVDYVEQAIQFLPYVESGDHGGFFFAA